MQAGNARGKWYAPPSWAEKVKDEEGNYNCGGVARIAREK